MEIIYYAASSLDGYIATIDGGVEWLDPFQGGSEDSSCTEFYKSIDVLLMGSRTYDFALEHLPWLSPDKQSWVFTKRDLPIAHPSVTLTNEDPATVVASLKEQGFHRAWLMGGGILAGSFQKQGLITEYAISVVPVLLGKGIPLFVDSSGVHSLKLIDTTRYESGIVQLKYGV